MTHPPPVPPALIYNVRKLMKQTLEVSGLGDREGTGRCVKSVAGRVEAAGGHGMLGTGTL